MLQKRNIREYLVIGLLTCACGCNRQQPYTTQEMTVTAYCAGSCCCSEYADGITASGHKIQIGDKIVAAPKNYGFGQVMDVPGYGLAVVRDRGGAIVGDKIDVYFDTHEQALIWGKQRLKVRVFQ